MTSVLSRTELQRLVERVFAPTAEDRALAVLVDLPDAQVPDRPAWAARRAMAAGWARELASLREALGLEAELVVFRNVRMNNADLPEHAWRCSPEAMPDSADALDPAVAVRLDDVLATHSIVLAPTQFSATAPLKLAAKRLGFRAATMPGFSEAMLPALRIDFGEVDRRVRLLKRLLDDASGATIVFAAAGEEHALHVDLRHRTAHASSGLLTERGVAGNLPSGEAYIVPYEGELPGDASRTAGALPVELDGEIVVYDIRENRARGVRGAGAVARREAEHLRAEPAYGNIAELGLGVLSDLGAKATGVLLLDEKLGLHLAFGRSDHFGGQVGARDFSRPEAVVHIDRVYVPDTQPGVRVVRMDLEGAREVVPLLRDGRYVVELG